MIKNNKYHTNDHRFTKLFESNTILNLEIMTEAINLKIKFTQKHQTVLLLNKLRRKNYRFQKF